jgi:hypothetical protein
MTTKLHELRQPTNRSAAPRPDWAAAATEARRQRDAKVKAVLTERQRLGRQERAWSPKEFSGTRKV